MLQTTYRSKRFAQLWRYLTSALGLLAPLMYFTNSAGGQMARVEGSCGTSRVVALVGERRICESQLDGYIGDKLLRFETEQYNNRRRLLEALLDDLLIANEAQARGVSVDDLLRSEISGKVSTVSEAEIHAALDVAPQKYSHLPSDKRTEKAASDIREGKLTKLKSSFVSALRAQYRPIVLLPTPRAKRQFSGRLTVGPRSAPVSIVVFSDFQCPFCATLASSLDRLRREFPNDVQVLFKNAPSASHPQAAAAAEAALCAAEQQRFWQMHDVLFGAPALVSSAGFDEAAARANLDVNRFRECFTSRRFVAEWTADKAEAVSVGVVSTPALFVNGRFLAGAQPLEVLRSIVKEELRVGAAQ